MKATDSGLKLRRRVRSLMLYGLLVAGSAVFLLPFLVMIGTSMKMDREMGKEGLNLFPERPRPALRSPYIDLGYYTPPEQPGPDFTTILHQVETLLPVETPASVQEAVAAGVMERLRQTLPNEVWSAPPAERSSVLQEAVNRDLIQMVLQRTERRLALRSIRVKSLDLQEKELTQELHPIELWKSEEAPLRAGEPGNPKQAVLHYDLSAEGKQQVRLVADLDLPFAAERLHRVSIGLQPDDGWHALHFELEYAGTRYRAVRPQHTGGLQARVVTLQPFGPDDRSDSMRIRHWIPYRPVAEDTAANHGANTVRVIATLQESSLLDAWKHKAARNYQRTFNYTPFWRYAATSAVLVILNIVGTLFSCSLAAYAFARLQWPGRNLAFGIMLATMMIPAQVTMIPYFLVIRSLGWYNTLTPLWVMALFGNSFNIFLLRQFIKGIPRDLEDAARIDGCHFMQIYWHVIMPLIKPTLACIAVFTFTAVWNDFMGPLIFLSDQRLYPLSLGLYALQVQEGGNTGMMMAGSLLMTLPVVVLFFAAQRYFIQGIALTGTKG